MNVFLGALLGLVLGVLIHSFFWWLRGRAYGVAAVLGAACAVGITWAGVVAIRNPYLGEIHRELTWALGGLWVLAVALGALHATVLRQPVWGMVPALFLDAAAGLAFGFLGVLVRDAVIPRYSWQLAHRVWNAYALALAAVIGGLALLRPLLRPRQDRAGFPRG